MYKNSLQNPANSLAIDSSLSRKELIQSSLYNQNQKGLVIPGGSKDPYYRSRPQPTPSSLESPPEQENSSSGKESEYYLRTVGSGNQGGLVANLRVEGDTESQNRAHSGYQSQQYQYSSFENGYNEGSGFDGYCEEYGPQEHAEGDGRGRIEKESLEGLASDNRKPYMSLEERRAPKYDFQEHGKHFESYKAQREPQMINPGSCSQEYSQGSQNQDQINQDANYAILEQSQGVGWESEKIEQLNLRNNQLGSTLNLIQATRNRDDQNRHQEDQAGDEDGSKTQRIRFGEQNTHHLRLVHPADNHKTNPGNSSKPSANSGLKNAVRESNSHQQAFLNPRMSKIATSQKNESKPSFQPPGKRRNNGRRSYNFKRLKKSPLRSSSMEKLALSSCLNMAFVRSKPSKREERRTVFKEYTNLPDNNQVLAGGFGFQYSSYLGRNSSYGWSRKGSDFGQNHPKINKKRKLERFESGGELGEGEEGYENKENLQNWNAQQFVIEDRPVPRNGRNLSKTSQREDGGGRRINIFGKDDQKSKRVIGDAVSKEYQGFEGGRRGKDRILGVIRIRGKNYTKNSIYKKCTFFRNFSVF